MLHSKIRWTFQNTFRVFTDYIIGISCKVTSLSHLYMFRNASHFVPFVDPGNLAWAALGPMNEQNSHNHHNQWPKTATSGPHDTAKHEYQRYQRTFDVLAARVVTMRAWWWLVFTCRIETQNQSANLKWLAGTFYNITPDSYSAAFASTQLNKGLSWIEKYASAAAIV